MEQAWISLAPVDASSKVRRCSPSWSSGDGAQLGDGVTVDGYDDVFPGSDAAEQPSGVVAQRSGSHLAHTDTVAHILRTATLGRSVAEHRRVGGLLGGADPTRLDVADAVWDVVVVGEVGVGRLRPHRYSRR